MRSFFNNCKSVFGNVLLFAIAALFTYAGTIKLSDIDSFRRSIEGFALLPEPLIPGVGYAIPIMELVLALGLLLPGTQRLALWGVGSVVAAFLGLLLYALFSGLVVDCGCLGTGEASRTVMIFGVLRNLVILGAVGFLLRIRPSAQNGAGANSSP